MRRLGTQQSYLLMSTTSIGLLLYPLPQPLPTCKPQLCRFLSLPVRLVVLQVITPVCHYLLPHTARSSVASALTLAPQTES